jgi:signal recognition particle subunit SRP19
MPPTKSMPTKGKQAGTNKTVTPPVTATGRRLPIPPEPHPTLATRLSPYSPALSTGVLVDTVKAGMSAQENAGGIGGSAGVSGGQKGKRKLVRVRG